MGEEVADYPVYEFANQRRLTIMSHVTDYFEPQSVSIYKRYEGLAKTEPGCGLRHRRMVKTFSNSYSPDLPPPRHSSTLLAPYKV